MSVLGERLKKLREEREWTQIYVAEQLGMKRSSTYANWEYGLRDPDTETLVKLAKLYQVSTDYLTGFSEVELKPKNNEDHISALDKTLIHEIKTLSNEDKKFVLEFIQRIKGK